MSKALSATLAINQYTRQLIAQGKRVCKLGFGQSPFPVPDVLVEALKRHAAEKDYLPVAGLLKLREEIAQFYTEDRGLQVEADQIVIGPGSKELIFLTQLVKDAPLGLPNPSWVSYAPQAKMIKKEVHWIESGSNEKYKLQAESLENVLSQGRVKLVILNYPSNPTGVSHSKEELEGLARVFRRHGTVVIADEIYSRLQYKSDFTSLAKYYPEGTIICSGLSKWCGAGGWRIGYMVFPKELNALRSGVLAAGSETYSCAAAPMQYAAIAAFSEKTTMQNYLENSNRILAFVRDAILKEMDLLKIECSQTEGGFYSFISFEHFREKLSHKGISTGEQLCKYLLENHAIVLLPGTAFGRPAKELSARLAFVDFKGNELLKKSNISKYNFSLNEDFPNIKLFLYQIAKFLQ